MPCSTPNGAGTTAMSSIIICVCWHTACAFTWRHACVFTFSQLSSVQVHSVFGATSICPSRSGRGWVSSPSCLPSMAGAWEFKHTQPPHKRVLELKWHTEVQTRMQTPYWQSITTRQRFVDSWQFASGRPSNSIAVTFCGLPSNSKLYQIIKLPQHYYACPVSKTFPHHQVLKKIAGAEGPSMRGPKAHVSCSVGIASAFVFLKCFLHVYMCFLKVSAMFS